MFWDFYLVQQSPHSSNVPLATSCHQRPGKEKLNTSNSSSGFRIPRRALAWKLILQNYLFDLLINLPGMFVYLFVCLCTCWCRIVCLFVCWFVCLFTCRCQAVAQQARSACGSEPPPPRPAQSCKESVMHTSVNEPFLQVFSGAEVFFAIRGRHSLGLDHNGSHSSKCSKGNDNSW